MTHPDPSFAPAGSLGPGGSSYGLSEFASRTQTDWTDEYDAEILSHSVDQEDFANRVKEFLDAMMSAFGGNPTPLINLIATYQTDTPVWMNISGWSFAEAILSAASAVFPPLGKISLGQLVAGESDNLLTGFGDFGSSETIADEGVWTWDGSVGRTDPGSAKTTADGTTKVITSELIGIGEGQVVNVKAYVQWNSLTGSGDIFQLQLQTFLGDSLVATQNIDTETNPAASGSWTLLSGSYTIPAGVDGVRLRMVVLSNATAGNVWYDDASLTVSASVLPQEWIDSLPEDLQDVVTAGENLANNINGAIDDAITGGIALGTGIIADVFPTIANVFGIAKSAQIQINELTAASQNPGNSGYDGMNWQTIFAGADGAALSGTDWPLKNGITIRGSNGYAGIQSGASTNSNYYALAAALYTLPTQYIACVLGDSGKEDQYTYICLRCNSAMTQLMYAGITQDDIIIGTASGTAGSWGTTSNLASASVSIKTGDIVAFRVNDSGVFQILVNNVVRLQYADGSNTYSANRYGGFIMSKQTIILTYESFRIASITMSDWVIPDATVITSTWAGTLAQYNAITTKSNTTMYVVLP